MIKSEPSEATIFIDGKKLGTTPYRFELVSGNYDLRLAHDKYQNFTKRVYIDSSKKQYRFSMEREKKIEKVKKETPKDKVRAEKVSQKREQRNLTFYVQADGAVGTAMEAGLGLGLYVKRFNVEAAYDYGLAKEDFLLF